MTIPAEFIKHAIQLLHRDNARSHVLHVLSDISHYQNADILRSLARFTTTIITCAEDDFGDIECVEKAVCVLTHTALSIFDDLVSPELATLVPLPRLIRFCLAVIRLPSSTSTSSDHFLTFCFAARRRIRILESVPDSVDFLVACTRAPDVRTRNSALRALAGLFDTHDLPISIVEDSDDASRFVGNNPSSDSTPDECIHRFTSLIDTFATHRSLSTFGRELADMIVRREHDVRSCLLFKPWQDILVERVEFALPSHEFLDLLPISAGALRTEGAGSSDLVRADILQVEYLLATERTAEARAFSRLCTEKHPSWAFFYYGATIDTPLEEMTVSFRLADKGLQCSESNAFLLEQLLYLAASFAGSIVTDILNCAVESSTRFQDACDLLRKGLSHAAAFVATIPVDCHKMPFMVALTVYFDFILRGADFADDSKQLEVRLAYA